MSERSLEKKKLMEARDRYKKELQHEVKDMTAQANQALKTALIIGGTLAAGYAVARQFTKKAKKKSKVKNSEKDDSKTELVEEYPVSPSFFSVIGERLLMEATFFLLDIAKDKIRVYLESLRNEDEDSDVDSGE